MIVSATVSLNEFEGRIVGRLFGVVCDVVVVVVVVLFDVALDVVVDDDGVDVLVVLSRSTAAATMVPEEM